MINQLPTIFFFLLLSAATMYAQDATLLYSEDFAGGIPEGWMNEDANNVNGEWTYCPNPITLEPASSCPLLWNDGPNVQTNFAAPTADNGFVVVNSDAVGNEIHLSRLTTEAINFEGQDEVWLQFYSHIGVFTRDADENAIVRVSTDNGANWTPFTAFPGLVTGSPNPPLERWSANPQRNLIDITSVAAGEPEVLIQWEWLGEFEYHWSLDDVGIFDADPRPAVDLAISTNFFSVAPNYQTPSSQVTSIPFVADVLNEGSQDVAGADLTLNILRDNEVVFTTTNEYDVVLFDSLVENVIFPDQFTPAMEPAEYTGQYVLETDEEDGLTDNNLLEFNFFVTDTLFSRSEVPVTDVIPNAGPSFIYGNVYYVPNGADLFARYVSFGFSNTTELVGKSMTIFLYSFKPEDLTINSVDNNFNQADLGLPIGFSAYEITEDDMDDELFTVPISTDGGVPLEDDTYYWIAIEYITSDDIDAAILASRNQPNYNASFFTTDSLDNVPTQHGSFLDVGQTGDIGIAGYGYDISPYIAMSIGNNPNLEGPAIVSSIVELSADNKIEVMPNPVTSTLQLNVELAEVSDKISVSIFSIQGQLIEQRRLQRAQVLTETFSLQQQPAGMYFIKVDTDAGSRVLKVSKQ